MTEEEKQAIERLKSIDETTEEYDGNLFKADFETVLNLIEKQQAEIEEYKEMYAVSVADRVNSAFEQKYKNDEDLEMLYKGCQIELEEKDKITDEMAKYIAGLDIEEDICVKTGKLGECDSMAYGECENCIKEYFKKKVQKT